VPQWLKWARRLQGIGQAGLTYARDPYDAERYREVLDLAAEIGAAGSDGISERIAGFYASQHGYPTPKVDVRAAIVVEQRILLVRERDDDGWAMPGGWADIGESAAEAAERETLEEAGVQVVAEKLIALFERERHGHPPHPEFSYKAFFACRPVGEVLLVPSASSHDVGESAFFAPDRLPELSVARITRGEIEMAFRHQARPDLPAEFD
jgi:ADP-ribose pyrophosphatase YjhB (NUDIX family)